jgi:hypothetical protein
VPWAEARDARWVEPVLFAEVEFTARRRMGISGTVRSRACARTRTRARSGPKGRSATLEATRRSLIKIAFDVPLWKVNPWILGLALGRWPWKVPDECRRDSGLSLC